MKITHKIAAVVIMVVVAAGIVLAVKQRNSKQDQTQTQDLQTQNTTPNTTPPPPPPPPTPAAKKSPPPLPDVAVGICASRTLEVYARDIPNDWAKARCTTAPPSIPSDANGFALNWRDAIMVRADGLTYATFLVVGEELGGEIRWNDNPAYQAVVVGHPGGGGTQFPLTRDAGPADSTDWKNLQDAYGMRVVEISWLDALGTRPGGRFTHKSPAADTLLSIDERPKRIFEWIYDNLNPDGKPFGLIGSSGGADAVLSTQLLQSKIKDKIAYLAPVSYPPPFFDPFNTCHETTPPGTFVNPAAGAPGNSGVGALRSGVNFVDSLLRTPNQNCRNKTITAQMVAGSSGKDVLQAVLNAGGSGYKGTLHMLVGTNAAQDSDSLNGAVWSAGNLMHHPFFVKANRIWFESQAEGHGDPFTESGPGFTQVYNEIIKTLITNP